MDIKRMLLFVGPDCPKCHEVIRGMVDSHVITKKVAERIPTVPQFVSIEDMPVLGIFDSGTVDGLAAGAFHNVRSLPTLLYMDNGKTIKRIDGEHEAIAEMIAKWARGEKFF